MLQTHGDDISIYEEIFLAKALEKRRVAADCDDAMAYLKYFAQDRAEQDTLLRSLNNNYSNFFRNSLTFALLEQTVLPRLADDALTLARQGVYKQAEVQNMPLKYIQKFFSVRGEFYEAIPSLKERIHFSSYDLLDEGSTSPSASIYGNFDLVFCCNLLFYYRADIRQRILDKIFRAIRPGGYLVTGEAERDIVEKHKELRALSPYAAVFHKSMPTAE